MKIACRLLLTTCCLALAGCGQIGPLYLPKPTQPAPDIHTAPTAHSMQAPAAASLNHAASAATPPAKS